MTMKKTEVLRYLPNVKTLSRDAVTKYKTGSKLVKEAERARIISEALKGVTLHDNFPVKVRKYQTGFEVLSGCEDVKRSAYVKTGSGTKYVVVTYNNTTDADSDGTPVAGEFKKKDALKVAKDYVANGAKKTPKVASRGRVASK